MFYKLAKEDVMAGSRKKSERDLYMTLDETKIFISTAYAQNPIHGILWDITLNGGLRISETLSIRPRDIDYAANIIQIQTLKQKREVEKVDILFPARTIDILHKIILCYNIKPDKLVFDITRQYAWKIFKATCRKAKLSSEYSPHALRHAHGIMVSNAVQGDLVKIAKRMRHASPSNAWRYVHLSHQDQKEIVDYIEK